MPFSQLWDPGVVQARIVHNECDARERTRLELVGLASEVATQATRIEETLRVAVDSAREETREQARELATRAWAVLDPHATAHHFSHEVLEQMVLDLRRDQRAMLALRETADRLVRSTQPIERALWKSLSIDLDLGAR